VAHGGEAVNRSEWMAVTGARNILRDEAEILENFAQRSENDRDVQYEGPRAGRTSGCKMDS